MPATLKKLVSKTNKVAIEIDGDPEAITVEYSTRLVTPAVQAEINQLLKEAQDNPDDMRSVIRQFQTFVVGWDLAADEGKPPIPLDEKHLMQVPIEILSMVLDTVTTDLDPKGKTGTSSNGRSPAPPSTN